MKELFDNESFAGKTKYSQAFPLLSLNRMPLIVRYELPKTFEAKQSL